MSYSMMLDYYRHEFMARRDTLPGNQIAWLRRDRAEAMARLMASGLPNARMEAWKYTSLPFLTAGKPYPLAHPTCMGLDPEDLASLLVQRGWRQHMVFVNGTWSRSLSDLSGLPDGVRVCSLAAMMKQNPDEALAGFTPEADHQGFPQLNRALWQDGVFLHISRDVELATPLQLLFLTTSTLEPQFIQPRNLLLVSAGARLPVVECHVALAGDTYPVTNIWTSLRVAEHAQVHHVMVIDPGAAACHLGGMRATLDRGASLTAHMLNLGSRISRQEVQVDLTQPGSACHLAGLSAASGRQQADFQIKVHHNSRQTTSHQDFRGLADGHGRAIFNGLVRVAPGVEQVVSSQTSHNLLLASTAEIDTKPQLEIHAQDVQCTHGATVGHLDEDALFYLRSRGVDEGTARQLLVDAFAHEFLDQVTPAVLQAWMTQRFSSWRDLT